MPRKYTKKKNKKGGTPPKTISNRENIMNDEIIILKNRLDELEAKLEICCRDMVQGANTIQRMTRGHQSRKDTKIMKRGLNPNITDALLDLPQDVGDLIATHRKTIRKTKGWTIVKNADSYAGDNWGGYIKIKPGFNIDDLKKYRSKGQITPGGFVLINNRDVWFRSYTSDDCVKNLKHIIFPHSWIKTSLFYVAPGASFELLKLKEIEGFEIIYDSIDL